MDTITKQELIYSTKPYAHQKDCLEIMFGREAFALFLEMGCGKSKIVIDETINLIERDMINCVIILAPNGVHENWKQQYETHAPNNGKIAIQVYKAQPSSKARDRQEQFTREIIASGKVLVFLMNVESLSHESGTTYLHRILSARRKTYLVIDESHKIKTQSARRTKTAIALGALARYRRILTGTEAEEGLHNLYSQFKFLDWNIIGFRYFTPFRSMYCVMGGYEGRQILGYRNQKLLAEKIAPYTFQIRKHECLDLPEKTYIHHRIDMTPEQENLYRMLEEELLIEFDEKTIIDTTMVLTRMIKLQEVLCGHLQVEGKMKLISSNRAKLVSEIVEGTKKSIVFCRFVKDVELVVTQLASDQMKAIGITGETKDRMIEINSWRTNPDIPALVMTTQTGGVGLTLVEASNMIFYSNSFSGTDRVQAEDRIHRIGQIDRCSYHDITVKGKLDDIILKALRMKANFADQFRMKVKQVGLRGYLEGEDNG